MVQLQVGQSLGTTGLCLVQAYYIMESRYSSLILTKVSLA